MQLPVRQGPSFLPPCEPPFLFNPLATLSTSRTNSVFASMTREQLRAFADRFLDYVNTPDSDPNKLLNLVAQDLKTPLTYPGAPSGYVGVKGIIEKLHAALSEYQLKLLTPIIDEEEGRVVYFVKSMGVQTGYDFPLT